MTSFLRLLRRTAALAVVATVSLTGCSTGGTDGGSASGGQVGSVQSGPAKKFRGLEYTNPPPRPKFILTDTSGALYDFNAMTTGKPTLLFFGYTTCPDVCPTTMGAVAAALDEIPAALKKELQVVFVTTDPKTDTGPVLEKWLSKFDGGAANKFVGLTGSQADIDAAQTAAGIPLAEEEGKQHSTLMSYYGRSNKAKVAFLSGLSPSDIAHDLPLAAG